MTQSSRTISDEEIQAHVDHALAPAEHVRITQRLQEDPAALARAENYRFQRDGLRTLYDDLLERPIPDRLWRTLYGTPPVFAGSDQDKPDEAPAPGWALASRPPPRWPRIVGSIAAVILVGVLGGAAGWISHAQYMQSVTAEARFQSFLDQVHSAYSLYSGSQSSDPIDDDQFSNLVAILTDRLGVEIDLPRASEGFELVQGQLIPIGNSVGAVFVYRGENDQRMNIYVQRNWDTSRHSHSRLERDDIDYQYAFDGPLAYAMAAPSGMDQQPGLKEWLQSGD